MRTLLTLGLCLSLTVLAGCAGSRSSFAPAVPGAHFSSGITTAAPPAEIDVSGGDSLSLTFNGTGTTHTRVVTFVTQFAGTVMSKSANVAVASVDPPTQTSQHDAGGGKKSAAFTITPTGAGTTTIRLIDKKGGTATITVTVVTAHGIVVVNGGMNLLEEFSPGAAGTATPTRILQSAYNPRAIAYDAVGDLYISSGTSVEVFAPHATAPTKLIRGFQTQLNCSQGIAVAGNGDTFVMNCGQVTVFAAGADGNASPIRTLQVPNAGPELTIATDAGGDLYVFQPSLNEVDEYSPGASGNAAPTRSITSADLGGPPFGGGLAVDGSGKVYVHLSGSVSGPPRVVVFDASAGLNSTPIHTITGVDGQYVAVDQTGNLWQTNFPGAAGPETLTEFAAGADGSATPIAQFNLPGLTQNGPVALDPSGNPHVADIFLDIVNGYAPSSVGNATPIESVSLGNPGVAQANGLAIDSGGAIYVANAWEGQVPYYHAMQNGSPSPDRVLGAVPTLPFAGSVAIDAAGYLYASRINQDRIDVYTPGASGTTAPLRSITGPDTGLGGPHQLALDRSGNIVVVNASNNSVTVYSSTASGDAAPLSTIAGSNTGITTPLSVAIDSTGAIYVGNAGNGTTAINVFAAGATGNVSPIRSMSGSFVPSGITSLAIDSGDYLYALLGQGIAVWEPGASGNPAPYRQIQQSATEGGFWTGIAIEP